MYSGHRVIVIAPVLNEALKIGQVVTRLKSIPFLDEIVVVDDGSTDTSAEVAKNLGATVISMGHVAGVGAALRTGFEYAKKRCEIIVVIAGNNKDEPKEIIDLISPIVDRKMLFVQGVRYLKGGHAGGDMPLYRKLATRLHPLLFSLLTGKKIYDSTNGFRAFHVSILDQKEIQLSQSWLDEYELEPYLFYKVVKLGLAYTQVPVTKIYPSRKIGNTKMKPVTGWWSILRPLFLLGTGVKH